MAETGHLAPPDPPRFYDDRGRAAALAALDANKGNVKRTARQLQIPESTLRDWAKCPDATGTAPLARLRAKRKVDLSAKLKRLAHKMVGVAYRKAETIDAYRATIAACAATDKALVLDGQPNVIHGQIDARLVTLDNDQLDQVERMLADAERRLTGQPVTVDAQPPVDMVKCADMTDTSGRETVQADAERPGDPRRALQGGRAGATEQPADGPLGETGAPRQLGRADPLVGEHGPQAGGEGVGG